MKNELLLEFYKRPETIFVKDNYDVFRLANKLYSPSYVSLEIVLAKIRYYKEGELLDNKQKAWVKENLISDTIFQLKLRLDNL